MYAKILQGSDLMRILGFDPGIATIGFAVLDVNNSKHCLVKCGVITTPAHTSLSSRLELIYEDAVSLLNAYTKVYSDEDEQSEWFEKIKSICPDLGFAPDTKTYKSEPQNYKGHPGDVATLIRIAVTGRSNTPDLCSIMQVLGYDECIKRIDNAKEG